MGIENMSKRTAKIEIGERLFRATVYYTAYMTALSLNDNDAAEKLLVTAKTLIES